jgi:DeoR family glycerol-3-phosphate regulon repressor
MVNLERQDEILGILSRKKRVSVPDLAKSLYVSEATIRRDLQQMANLGLIRRTHGGALIARDSAQESAFAMREASQLPAKKAICALVVNYLQDQSTLFVDSSSTMLPIGTMLQRFRHLTLVTHGIRTALMLSNLDNVDVFLAGGKIENFSNSILGSTVMEFYERMNADYGLLSCSGINENGDITDDNPEIAKVKEQIIKKAKKVYLLCDSSKFGKTRMTTSFSIDDVDVLFTDKRPNDAYLKLLEAHHCQVVTPLP